jgi:N6-adenosine-specific RNA methylase IME4
MTDRDAGRFGAPGTLLPGHAPLRFHPLANLFPMLVEERRPSFRESLTKEQWHPITLFEGGVLDGRNRYRELSDLNKSISYRQFVGTRSQALDFVIAENLERRDLSDKDRARIAGEIGKLKLGANQHTREPPPSGGPSLDLGDAATEPERAPLSAADRAQMMNVSVRSVERVDAINSKGAEELKAAVAERPISLATAETIAQAPVEQQREIVKLSDKEILEAAKKIRKGQNDERRAARVEKLKAQAAGNSPLSTVKKFPVIYFDPATKFAAGDSDRSTENHYLTMKEEDIAALPIGELATDDAVLFMWSTAPWLRKSIRLIEGWGFEYKTNSIWDKETIGLGFWFQNQHEHLIVATRGKMVAPENGSILGRSVYREKKGEHSAKPLHFRDIIGNVPEYRDLPKVELFARIDGAMPDGWFAWGNEARVPQQQSLLEHAEATE